MPELKRFEGFAPEATRWFQDLARNNNKVFFDRTRGVFEARVRGPLMALLHELADEFGGEVKIFRQNRDIRFSADKSPYKLNTYGIVHGRPNGQPGLYASISADGLYAATGYYQMARDQLDRYRAAVDDGRTGPRLERIVADAEAAGLEMWGERLKTVPRGYPKDHPRARLLAHKDLIAGALLAPGTALRNRGARDFAAATWRAAEPLVAWLDANVGKSELPPAR
jgi:uncharacterized protein (TIGR02453 family)